MRIILAELENHFMKSEPMAMRPSRVLEILRGGGVARCVKLNFSDPRVCEVAAMSGFDCIWLDTEHTANTREQIENGIRAARAHQVDAMVRVGRGSYSDLLFPLEQDASGIMVPHVMTAEEARGIVRQTRFSPIGRRPIDGGNADGAYGQMSGAEYIRGANTNRFVIIQIEDPEAMEVLDEIAAVDGVDMLFFGPGDFAHGLGVPFDLGDSRVSDARKSVAEAARRHGRFAGTVGSPDTFASLVEEGYQFISLGADVIGLGRYFRDLLAGIPERNASRHQVVG